MAGIAVLAYYGGKGRTGIALEIWWLRVSGYGAFGFLALSLLVTPIRRLIIRLPTTLAHRSAPFVAWRRTFGITSAILALGHAGVAMGTYVGWRWKLVWDDPFLRSGAVAVGILVILLVTSFPKLLKIVGIHYWKQLHRLSYVAAFFVFLHLLHSPFASRRLVFTLFGIVALLGLLRFLPRRPKSKGAENADESSNEPDFEPASISK